jgi:cellulose synthase/poly-beta-1,6-N-acetylglucosamine synthase-like glycosyltransferase
VSRRIPWFVSGLDMHDSFPARERSLAYASDQVRPGSLWSEKRPVRAPLTVIVPAYNEAESLEDTILSIQQQTLPPEEIIVIDDCSTDDTAEVARRLGATVIRPPVNSGSKAGAQTYALSWIRTELTLAVDADTTLAPDAIAKLLAAFDDPAVVAACGTVLPRNVGSMWERGRYVEYLFAFSFYKRVQEQYGKPFISSGCFSMYRTSALRDAGGWSTRTMAEDMDLTWTFYQRGHEVRFIWDAVCYPIEPHNFAFMRKQLRRWSHGFVQNVRLHWKDMLEVPFLRTAIAVACWDAALASVIYLLLLPVLAITFSNPYLFLGYVIDVPAVVIPVMIGAIPRGEARRALASLPSFFVLRTVNAVFFLSAIWNELVRGRTLRTYEKGH